MYNLCWMLKLSLSLLSGLIQMTMPFISVYSCLCIPIFRFYTCPLPDCHEDIAMDRQSVSDLGVFQISKYLRPSYMPLVTK